MKTTVTVAVMVSDPLVRQGVAAYLRTRSSTTPVSPEGLDRADVVLIIAGQVGEETLSLMQSVAERVPDREMRFVLVCDEIREAQLLRVLGWGDGKCPATERGGLRADRACRGGRL